MVENKNKISIDLASKLLIAIIPVILSIASWAWSIDGRLKEVAMQQNERGPRIAALEEAINADSGRVERRLSRIEERINNLHIFILQVVPSARGGQRRGDLGTPPGPFKDVN